ncbi:TetR/AcrR family transcriptional regulator [Bowmanella yangjiangensis]|uniref:TetR/AcrR family transcriptional regulator n=1 Tax=Bowmanella yangjiangensis TaxID=2811230 RepID=A0ABS3CSY1_9ALTE|nr:TetR/AcrR family transcriptional regulator [Bowmanella yangjiangensis]MBN7819385.1 TetR/AcrR family transcriptional regulator [Bowmanella yangjiangensis]
MRQAEFDREQVLRSALKAFLNKGYGKTSMQDLTKATGLHPGSIYCAFGNKRGLLVAAVEQYKEDRDAQFAATFPANAPVLPCLKRYLDELVNECHSCDSSRACFLVKALNEMADQDAELQAELSTSLESWQAALEAQIQRAKDRGELAADKNPQVLARYLVMGIYGLRTYAQTHPQREVLQQLADQLYLSICQ